jgi:rubrerythrin
MRPLPTRPSDDAGAADQGPPAGDQPLPAPPPPPDPLAAASAAPHKRGAMRRRLRKLRRERADQLAKLGTLVIDARRRANGSQPEVVERRTAEVAELDRQVRELAHAVDPHTDSRELASGIAGGCRECGALLSTEDRFCPACGTPTNPRRKRPDA